MNSTGTLVADNGITRVTCNLKKGTFEVKDVKSKLAINEIAASWNEAVSTDVGLLRSGETKYVGSTKTLTMRCKNGTGVVYVLEFELRKGQSAAIMKQSVFNKSSQPVRLFEFQPVRDGQLTIKAISKAMTLNGDSGAIQTQVLPGIERTSKNNLLATFVEGRTRRSVVLGGLTYAEFCKEATIGSQGSRARIDELSQGNKVVAYEDCGGRSHGPIIQLVKGTTFDFGAQAAERWASTIVFHEKEIVYNLNGLDPRKSYALGCSWWDYDSNGRRQSVWIESPDGKYQQRVLESEQLPQWTKKQEKAKASILTMPIDAYRSGSCRLRITNDADVPNAVVGEIWILDNEAKSTPNSRKSKGLFLNLLGLDPVGRLIEPGETWKSADIFYVDIGTPDPFLALEKYGLAVRREQKCRPNPYDFPTVCTWYAGVWKTPGAQNHPDKSRYKLATTAGIAEEAREIKKSGFLDYSRAAVRLVPDNYTDNNPQGWWDDAHWQREGFYTEPYETSEKWGRAMRELGVLAFTYFQPSGPRPSLDFRESHSSLLLKNRDNLDYTKLETLRYMAGVYANMKGNINGMMFDYCDDLWSREASGGGFADPRMTATAFYRQVLKLAKDGLGPDSWIHERCLWSPGFDIGLGISDSQRTSGDTDQIDPAMVSRSGLRWYKNRVVTAYDMDSKELTSSWKVPGFNGTDTDGRRMMLTMSCIAGSRLLLANSFRDLSPEALSDLQKTFPYPKSTRSARPLDAFSGKPWPEIYDYEVRKGWHVVTLFNTALPTKDREVNLNLAAALSDGGIGLNPSRIYYIYDFWNDKAFKVPFGQQLAASLRPGEARVLSIIESDGSPRLIGTNRHILQGMFDLVGEPQWNNEANTLSGMSRVVKGQCYRMYFAYGRFKELSAIKVNGRPAMAVLVKSSRPYRIIRLEYRAAKSETIPWKIQFKDRAPIL